MMAYYDVAAFADTCVQCSKDCGILDLVWCKSCGPQTQLCLDCLHQTHTHAPFHLLYTLDADTGMLVELLNVGFKFSRLAQASLGNGECRACPKTKSTPVCVVLQCATAIMDVHFCECTTIDGVLQ